MYCPPWEVRRGLNTRSSVDTLPFLITVPASSMTLSESTHSTAGWTTRPSTTVTVQVIVNTSPAVGVPVVVMATTGALRAVEKECEVFMNYSMISKKYGRK